jgi:hypothetical protein
MALGGKLMWLGRCWNLNHGMPLNGSAFRKQFATVQGLAGSGKAVGYERRIA